MTFVASAMRVIPPFYQTAYPLKVSSDGRSIRRADAQPFQMNGDAGTSMSTMATQADVIQYFQDRQARGVNTLWLEMIEHRFSDNSPAWRNVAGDLPFSGTVAGGFVDFTTPVEAYWSHIDWIIRRAYDFGILVVAHPCYLGFGMGTGVTGEGWAEHMNAATLAQMTTYGNFLGSRYASFPNLMWAMGGDSPPVGTFNLTTRINNLANGIKANDTVHLMTAHPASGNSAYDSYNQTWLDVNASYPGDETIVHQITRHARQQVAKPVFMFEARYGNEHTMTVPNLRMQMYQGALGGGVGHIYGQNPQWYFGTNSNVSCNSSGFADTSGVNWHTSLGSFGSPYLIYVARLLAARDLSVLSPDYAHTVITSGFDSGGVEGVTYCPVMANTRQLVAYITGGQAPVVDKSQFVARTFNVNWYNVRDGSVTSGGTASFGVGTQTMTPPDSNDWVLLLDDQTLQLRLP